MKISAYANAVDNWEAKRIVSEAQALGHEAEYLDYSLISLCTVPTQVEILYNGTPIRIPDIAVFRSARDVVAGREFHELATVLRDEIAKKGYVFNYQAMKIYPFGKLRQSYILAANGIPFVTTSMVTRIEEVAALLDAHRELVAKPIDGSSGDGIYRIEKLADLESYQINNLLERYVFQEVQEVGHDYRLVVLGDIVLGVMERFAREGEFVANFSKGGRVVKTTLDDESMTMAREAVRLFGLDYAGVDLIRDKSGRMKVLEINRFAQFKGFEQATGVNVAKKIVEYCLSKTTL